LVVGKHTVSDEFNIAKIIFVAFFKCNIQGYILFVENAQGIANNAGIAIAV